ncbi:heparan-alpha-glucosaminide N-acetyltransferase domain-containing protein [Undibacterium sp.]|uniref:acyltransferase family protein n=1 Tax=Undibacterium sp. TaxID=1914977 RepID=UPI0025FA7D29|nr:heparan-alpha-glucosaminide N-acetyltransferase domain-containing protein [Undibacterium sp.]
MKNPLRLTSIDALRGLTVAAMLLVNNAGDWDHVYAWLEHAAWNGCTPADFIFPFFLLIVGVSLHLALAPQLELASDPRQLSRSVVWRGVRIFVLGLALHLIAYWLIEGRNFRLMGVLQRIGICFAIVGLIAIHVRSIKIRWLIIAAILIGYGVLLLAGGSLQPDLNLVDKIDSLLLGKLAYSFNPLTGLAHEPEGLLSTLPSIATVLLGLQAGRWLRNGQAQYLWQTGLLALLAGYLSAYLIPLNKQLWTPSFVLWTAGFAYLCMSLAHVLIDVRGMPVLGRSFGINAIAAYAGSWVATCVLAATGWAEPLYRTLFATPLAASVSAEFASLAFATAFTAVFALLMWLFKQRGWRITV